MRYCIFSQNDCPLLKIDVLGYAKDPLVTRFGPGRRNQYMIHYVISGSGYFNGSPVRAGQGFVIVPGMHEAYRPDESDPWEYLWVSSEDARMAQLLDYCGADPATHVFDYGFTDVVREVAGLLYSRENAACDAFEMLEIFLRIFKGHAAGGAAAVHRCGADVYADAAVNYIRANLHDRLTVGALARTLNISQPYLYRVFRDKFGCSPKQYMDGCKLAQAKKLLRETDMTVTQIAASVGFCDVLRFSRFFSGKAGRSPQKFRAAGGAQSDGESADAQQREREDDEK